jgi:hypothetical protein
MSETPDGRKKTLANFDALLLGLGVRAIQGGRFHWCLLKYKIRENPVFINLLEHLFFFR